MSKLRNLAAKVRSQSWKREIGFDKRMKGYNTRINEGKQYMLDVIREEQKIIMLVHYPKEKV